VIGLGKCLRIRGRERGADAIIDTTTTTTWRRRKQEQKAAWFCRNPVKRLVAIVLALSPAFAAVSHATEVNSKEAKAVAEVKKLGGFVELDEKNPDKSVIGVSLKGTKVTDSGLEVLEGFDNLQSLDLSGTKATNNGLKRLKGLEKLRYLNLAGTKVSDSGLENLKSLTKLEYLDLRRTKVVSVKDFEKALPKCSIRRSK
jgi:hypothetical protein